MKKIELTELNLIKIDLINKEHIRFLKKIFENNQDEGIQYLGNLSNFNDSNAFIVKNSQNQEIGYLSMSNPITNRLGFTATSLYYIITQEFRGQGYGTILLKEISNYLLQNIDMIILSIDKTNIASRKIVEKVNFKIEYENSEDEEIIYTKYTPSKRKGK